MSTIEQLPYKIDSNVTIRPPKKIVIDHIPNRGWCIKLDGSVVKVENGASIRFWQDATGPMTYLADRHLIVTKAYKELDKIVKKVAKSQSSE